MCARSNWTQSIDIAMSSSASAKEAARGPLVHLVTELFEHTARGNVFLE